MGGRPILQSGSIPADLIDQTILKGFKLPCLLEVGHTASYGLATLVPDHIIGYWMSTRMLLAVEAKERNLQITKLTLVDGVRRHNSLVEGLAGSGGDK